MSIDEKAFDCAFERTPLSHIQAKRYAREFLEKYEAAKTEQPVGLPELPVSVAPVSLESCMKALVRTNGGRFVTEVGYSPKGLVKAVLDAAGVKYVD